jgi:hypothetical protein
MINRVLTWSLLLLWTPTIINAIEIDGEAATLILINPQVLSVVDTGSSEAMLIGDANGSQTLYASWKVKTNGGFYVDFSGTSKNDDGTDLNYPRLTKQDVDAAGDIIPNRYDHLTTTYGMELNNIGSLNVTEQVEWGEAGDSAIYYGGSAAPIFQDSELQMPESGHQIGIMPLDQIGEAGKPEFVEVRLYMQGKSAVDKQAGQYTGEVTLTITPYTEYISE